MQRLLYAPGSRKYAPLRLRRLVAAGYVLVDYPAPPRKAGRAQGVYALDAKGRRYVSEALELDVPPRFRPSELTTRSWSFYAHTLAVNDVLIAAELLDRQRPDVTLVETRHDLVLKQTPIRVRSGSNRVAEALVPDGYMLFRTQAGARRRRFPICLEMDMGTQGPATWRGKIRRYAAAFAGPLAEAFGVTRATIAIVALAGAPRRDRLREWTAAELATAGAEDIATRFLFTAHDPATTPPADFFLAPSFVAAPLASQPEALLIGIGEPIRPAA